MFEADAGAYASDIESFHHDQTAFVGRAQEALRNPSNRADSAARCDIYGALRHCLALFPIGLALLAAAATATATAAARATAAVAVAAAAAATAAT
jgi:hypothetical protein